MVAPATASLSRDIVVVELVVSFVVYEVLGWMDSANDANKLALSQGANG